MGLKDMVRRLKTTVDELDSARLQERFDRLELTPMAGAPERVPVRLGGEVTMVRLVPRAGIPTLEVVVSDGTGEVRAVFNGRTSLGGVTAGRGLLLEGVARRDAHGLVVLNPNYTLLAQ